MKTAQITEFPPTGEFPLEVEATSSEAVLRGTEKTRKGHTWVQASFMWRGHVMVIRLSGQNVVVRCPTEPSDSVRVQAGLGPSGLEVRQLHWPGRDPEAEVPDPLPLQNWPAGGTAVGMKFKTDRSRTSYRRNLADRRWVSAGFTHFPSHSSLRAVLYLGGEVWIGVPGMGQALHGQLGDGGLDLLLDNP